MNSDISRLAEGSRWHSSRRAHSAELCKDRRRQRTLSAFPRGPPTHPCGGDREGARKWKTARSLVPEWKAAARSRVASWQIAFGFLVASRRGSGSFSCRGPCVFSSTVDVVMLQAIEHPLALHSNGKLACAMLMMCVGFVFSLMSDTPSFMAKDRQINVFIYPHDACRVFHAGAVLRMCMAKGSACNVVQNPLSARAHAGAVTRGQDAFAVPVVTDGAISIGQSNAMAAYVGEKLGFASGIAERGGTAKGVQFMLDMRDFFNNVIKTSYNATERKLIAFDGLAIRGNGPDVQAVRARYDQFLVYLEDAIVGPFFFGDSPTYVDYYMVAIFEWLHIVLKEYSVPRYGPSFPSGMLADYPKVHAVLRALVNGNGVAGQDDSAFHAALLLE